MKPKLHIPRWVCAGAIGLGAAALVIQAVIDMYQGTRDIPVWSTEWAAQAWQMCLITGFIMAFATIGGCLLNARAWLRATMLYVLVVGYMMITITNSVDFMADNTLATNEAARSKVTQAKDIATIKNELALQERKDMLENQWRTYYSAKTPNEKERALAQIQAVTKEGPTLITADVLPVKAGGGGIWNRWFGWRQEAAQEAKAVAVPILIMIGKSLAITLGFALWPQAGQLPEPARDGQTKVKFGVNVAKFSKLAARSDIAMLAETGALNKMDVTGAALAERWRVSEATSSNWLRDFRKEGLILRERVGERNRLAVKAAPNQRPAGAVQSGENFAAPSNGHARLA